MEPERWERRLSVADMDNDLEADEVRKTVAGAEVMRREFPGVAGFSVQNLWYMRQFYPEYSGHERLQPLVGEIAWAHNLVIMSKCKEALACQSVGPNHPGRRRPCV